MSEQSAGAAGAARTEQDAVSVGALVSNVSRDLTALLRQELALARVELRQDAARTGKAAGALGSSLVAGQLGLLFGSIALWCWLSRHLQPEWAALLVAVLWLVTALVLYLRGMRLLRTVRLSPGRPANATTRMSNSIRRSQS